MSRMQQTARRWTAALAIGAAPGFLPPAGAIAQEAAALRVPRGGAVVVDGRLGAEEWSGARVSALSDGSELRLQHDDAFLYLAVRAARPGFPSVCVQRGDTVRVLHASAALGLATYARAGDAWTLTTPFTFGLRTRDTTAAGTAERQAYLREHGWLASTMYLGDRVQKELQIPLAFLDAPEARVALAYMLDLPAVTRPYATWPLGRPEGCANPRLARGFAPPSLAFRPDAWARLTLEP